MSEKCADNDRERLEVSNADCPASTDGGKTMQHGKVIKPNSVLKKGNYNCLAYQLKLTPPKT